MNIIRDIILIGILIAADLGSKYLIYDQGLLTGQPRIRPILNTGISRGIPISYRIVIPLTFVALIFFMYLYNMRNLTYWSFIPFMAGAIGNLVDRIRFAGVRDFIQIGSFPIFNLADILINIGVIMLIRRQIKSENKEHLN